MTEDEPIDEKMIVSARKFSHVMIAMWMTIVTSMVVLAPSCPEKSEQYYLLEAQRAEAIGDQLSAIKVSFSGNQKEQIKLSGL